MQIERMAAAVRPRRAWEAIDLGFVMARQWFWPLWLLWMATALPLFVITHIAFAETLDYATLILWWGKPIYEPALLFWLSRALFDDAPRRRDVLRQLPSILKPRLLSNISIRRLSPNRSFYLPVALLEGLRSRERWQRLEVLSRGQSAGTWLTIIGFVLESVLFASLFLTLVFLLPQELDWLQYSDLFEDGSAASVWVAQGFYLLSMSIVAPFYVAGGFALYLTRRTELEAWDIEISFRRIRDQHAAETAPVRPGVLASILAVTAVFCMSHPVESLAVELTPQSSKELIEEVLNDDAFGERSTEKQWRYVGGEDDEPDETMDLEWLETLGAIIGSVVRPIAWLMIALVLGWLIYFIFKNYPLLERISWRGLSRPTPPTELFGLQLQPESLPPDVAAEVRRLLAAGDLRGAVSLLYRGALIAVLAHDNIVIPHSATEGECRRLVGKARPAEESQFFTRLTETWLYLAYGHRLPEAAFVDTLCSQWVTFYGAR